MLYVKRIIFVVTVIPIAIALVLAILFSFISSPICFIFTGKFDTDWITKRIEKNVFPRTQSFFEGVFK